MPPLPAAVIDVWQGPPLKDGALVLPDGCRDLLLLVSAGGSPQWSVSALFDVAETVPAGTGDRFTGFRLHPAANIDVGGLLRSVQRLGDADPSDVLPRIDAHVQVDPRLAEILAGLSQTPSVSAAARRLGVSERTVERQAVAGTGRVPGYWKNLARVRRAAGDLDGGRDLATLALDHGFADQAHMTREFRRWFGVSPRQFRARPDLLAQVLAPAYR